MSKTTVGYKPGAGAAIAVDNIADALFQRVKLTLGAEGVDGNDISAANPMPIYSPNPISATMNNLPFSTSGAVLIGTAQEKLREDWPSIDPAEWTLVQNGGMTATCEGTANGARYLKIATGTAVGEYILQSVRKFKAPFKLVSSVSASQRIANQELHIEMVEVDATGALVTTTSPSASPSFNDARNGVGLIYDGTTATTAKYKLRGQGISEILSAAVTMGTTVATGSTPNFSSAIQVEQILMTEIYTSSYRAVNSAAAASPIVDRTDYVPDPDKLYAIRIRVKNLATVTTTDWRVHFIRVLDATRLSVDFGTIGGNLNDQLSAPVKIIGSNANLVTIGPRAHDGTWTSSYAPAMAGALAKTNQIAAVADNDVCQLVSTTTGALLVKPFAVPEQSWSYAAASGGIQTNTATQVKAAAGAGLRNYIVGFSLQNASATTPTEVMIISGASTVLGRYYLGVGALLNSAVGVQTLMPLPGGLNEAISVQCATTGANVYANIQGYIAP